MPKGDRLKLKADPEDGTTPIANLLIDALAIAKLSGLHKGAILHLWRVTYGWTDENGKRRKEAKVGLSEWAKSLDSTSPRASVTLSDLVQKNIIFRRVADVWGGYYYQLNTDIMSWNSGSVNTSKLREVARIPSFGDITEKDTITENVTVTESDNSSGLGNNYRKEPVTVTENVIEQLPKTEPPTLYKEILNKDINKDIYSDVVKLSKEEHEKLIIQFGEGGTTERITSLSLYIQSTGKKYKSHYATILNWERMNKGKNYGNNQNNNSASGQSKANNSENSKYTSGKYGRLVET